MNVWFRSIAWALVILALGFGASFSIIDRETGNTAVMVISVLAALQLGNNPACRTCGIAGERV